MGTTVAKMFHSSLLQARKASFSSESSDDERHVCVGTLVRQQAACTMEEIEEGSPARVGASAASGHVMC